MTRSTKSLALLILPFLPVSAIAGGIQDADSSLEQIVVEDSRLRQIGSADSANQGIVTAKQLENRPLSRTAELLEVIPGVIVTQHSGDGKANQYYVRGFNLDHGTDLRTTVLGMPVNMPSHAHGQGYSDLNFVIPELVKTIQYKKGTYYAEEGDFSAAGSAEFDYFRVMPKGVASIELGQHNYRRAVVANSTALGAGNLLYGVESVGQDGPWISPEKFKRFNGVLSYSLKSREDDFRVTGMALKSSWNSTDQIPQRAIDAGLVGRFGTIDATDGGDTSRYSLSGDWTRRFQDGALRVNAYVIRSSLDLFSNFTYAQDDRVNGDQFEQTERRTVAGVNAERLWSHTIGGVESETTVGVQLRSDRLSPVGLYSTVARQRLSTTREDQIRETAAGIFASNTTRWTPWFRTIAGLRADRYAFDVDSNISANSGSANDSIVSPKFSAIFSPTKDTEFYLNWGQGFHSNDARGVLQTIDPKTGLTTNGEGNPITRATPLAKAKGMEAGVRLTGLAKGLQTSVSLWQLDLASELVFVGDAGTTEASRPSHRTGIEIANYYVPAPGWIIDADLALSRANFKDQNAAGDNIPGAIQRTASVGISGEYGKFSGGVRLRYFGGRPLIEDNSVRSSASTLVNAKFGYAITKDIKITAEVLNLLDRKVSDIDYFYSSQLRSESAPVADIHTHPSEPRTVRVGLVVNF